MNKFTNLICLALVTLLVVCTVSCSREENDIFEVELGIHIKEFEKELGRSVDLTKTSILEPSFADHPQLVEQFPKYETRLITKGGATVTFFFNPDKKIIEIVRVQKRKLYSNSPF